MNILSPKVAEALSLLEGDLNLVYNNLPQRQEKCSRIIDNFKKKLIMKPGTILIMIINKECLQEDDIILYQPTSDSHYIFGIYSKIYQEFNNKTLFKFINEKDFNDSCHKIVRNMNSNVVTFHDKSELMLVKILEKDLERLELSHQNENGEKYATIIVMWQNSFRIGKYFTNGMVSLELSQNDMMQDEEKLHNTTYYTFMNEKKYLQENENKNENEKYEAVTLIQT